MGADFLEALVDDAMGDFRAIAFAAEVAQIQVPQIGSHDLLDAIGGGFVRQMTVAPQDALLESPRSMRAFL